MKDIGVCFAFGAKLELGSQIRQLPPNPGNIDAKLGAKLSQIVAQTWLRSEPGPGSDPAQIRLRSEPGPGSDLAQIWV